MGLQFQRKNGYQLKKDLLESSNNQIGFVLVAIDTGDCGIARLRGTHLEFMPNIYSGSGGKRYKTNFNIEKFFEQVQQATLSILKKGDSIVIFGPGETKKRFQILFKNHKIFKNIIFKLLMGIDSGVKMEFTSLQNLKQ